MSIATEISRLQQAKADIKTAIEGKGVTVPASALIDTYDDYIAQIEQGGGPQPPAFTGHVDTEGLTALGWDAEDIAWLQAHVWWNAEDDAYWAVTPANLAFGPNGATPLTWADRATIRTNPNVRYFPKFDPSPSSNTSWYALLYSYNYLCAIPTHGWDTSQVNNMQILFSNDWNLRSVGDLSSFNTSKVTSLNGMFSSCYNLLDVGNLDDWDISLVTTLDGMFGNCNSLSNVGDLSSWNTGAVTKMNTLFNNCITLKKVGDLSSWNTGAVTTLQNIFNNCYELDGLGDIGQWDTSQVTRIDSAFTNCRSLQSVGDLGNWDTSSMTNILGAFYGCTKLKTLGDLSSWDTGAVTNMNQFCYQHQTLQSIDCSSWDVTAVENASQMFSSVGLIKIDVSGWDLSACTNVGTAGGSSIFALPCAATIILGPKFFNFSPATFYMQNCNIWSRDSVYESLYTNQTLRNSSSPAKTVKLNANVYDTLSAQDISDIATKNITLTRG